MIKVVFLSITSGTFPTLECGDLILSYWHLQNSKLKDNNLMQSQINIVKLLFDFPGYHSSLGKVKKPYSLPKFDDDISS